MNQIQCNNCKIINPPGMVFCTNCGNRISVSAQIDIPTAPKLGVAPPTRPQNAVTTASNGSSKLWIGGIIGCLGLLFLGGIGAVIVAAVFNASKSDVTNSNTYTYPSPYPYPTPTVRKIQTEADVQSELTDVLNDKKEVGRFRLGQVNPAPIKDYFPFGIGAVVASYSNGSKYVTISIGKFENFEEAKRNFDDQFVNVKKNGGKSEILPVSKDGTINGVYQIKKNYFAEYCTPSAFCYRMVGTDPKSLKQFIEGFVTL